MHTALLDLMQDASSQRVFFEPLGGNNGDHLIEMGSRSLIGRYGLDLVPRAADANMILINGSGDLSYHNSDKPIETTRQARLLADHPNIPVVLLPSSTTAANAQLLQPVIKKRRSRTILFARDPHSFALLRELQDSRTQVFLEHDMAFGLLEDPWLQEQLRRRMGNTLLVVERFDAERATEPPRLYKARHLVRPLIPNFLLQRAKKVVLPAMYAKSSFVLEAEQELRQFYPGARYNRVVAADISLPQNYDFPQFVNAVIDAAAVVSTRLHVCILAALLGKPLVAVQFEGGAKLLGVFEHSLKNFPQTHLWMKSKTSQAALETAA